MKKIALFLLFWFSFSIFSPLLSQVAYTKKYTYESELQSATMELKPVYGFSASTSLTSLPMTGLEGINTSSFQEQKDVFILRIPKTFEIQDEEDAKVFFFQNGKKIEATLDVDGDARSAEDPYYYTTPLVLDPAKTVTYSLSLGTYTQVKTLDITLIGLDTKSYEQKLSFQAEGITKIYADTNSTAPKIVTRSEWGANEELRYEDSKEWKSIFEKLKANEDKPKSEWQIKSEQRIKDIRSYLKTNFGEMEVPVETIKSENGRSLVWNIDKSRKVQKIVIHHTAENNVNDKDDQSMIRGMYYYHTIVRGWGDIGYNFIVGQRGQIYEGRAGWDYTMAAHALWNNASTVGVSVIGNFQTENVNIDQENGIRSIVQHLSLKYGIDLNKKTIGHKECKTDGTCLLQDFETYNLIGHRDIGYTACPGDNLYPLIAKIREEASYSSGLTYKENPKITLVSIVGLSTENKGPTMRVRLSYPHNSIKLKSSDGTLPYIVLGKNAGTLKKNVELTFEPSTKAGQISLVLGKKKYSFSKVELSSKFLTITSWDRKPTWDKTGSMNDNVFRGKIVLYNEGGKLTVINELPLEDYLKGLAEISNGDNEEKVKTILVAARSYALFYTDPGNRKFPGKPYDGSDNPDEFQKYLGYGYEKRSPSVGKLVDETRGMVITYNGKLIKPWYFNESDGRTRSYKEYCQNRVQNGTLSKNTVCEDIPYLQGVVDPGGVGKSLKWHGVGISGIGSTYLATNMGFEYQDIIKYFLDGTKVEKKY